jgi:diguanylate cyclase (GGDEF)-like protein/PAS domain S-box-containing protein
MTVRQQRDAMRTSRQKVSWHDRYIRSEAARRSCEAHYRAVLENSTYGICHCNKQGEVVGSNRALLIMLSYKSTRELLAATLSTDSLGTPQQRARLLIARDKRHRIPFLESEWFRKDGTPIKVRVSGRAVQEHGEVTGFELIFENIDQQREIEEQLQRALDTDALTGLGTYRRLQQVLDGEIRRSKRTKRVFSVLLVDLDGLKHINDAYGHLAGNRALSRVADVLRQSCRSIDTPCRFGGDEFVLVMPETRRLAAKQVAVRISRWLAVDNEQLNLSVSVGVATYRRDGLTIEDLLHAADQRLYNMKTRKHLRSSERTG